MGTAPAKTNPRDEAAHRLFTGSAGADLCG